MCVFVEYFDGSFKDGLSSCLTKHTTTRVVDQFQRQFTVFEIILVRPVHNSLF